MTGMNNKYEKSGLKEKDMQDIIDELNYFMSENKPYLESTYSIRSLSEDINKPRHYISQTLSQKLNKNFYTFINELRIIKFKQLINNPQNDHFTIIALAFESGFNSKSCFNMVFKKMENSTPKEYRNNVLNNGRNNKAIIMDVKTRPY